MTVYADEAFLLNGAVDYLLLICAAKLGGGRSARLRLLAAALFGSMGAGDQLKLTPYQSAAEAAQAVAKGAANFAVSHQSQILEPYQQGGVDVVCAFDDKAIENGPFAGVEGVGSTGYPYFRNRCFVMARKGTDAAKVAELKELGTDMRSFAHGTPETDIPVSAPRAAAKAAAPAGDKPAERLRVQAKAHPVQHKPAPPAPVHRLRNTRRPVSQLLQDQIDRLNGDDQ